MNCQTRHGYPQYGCHTGAIEQQENSLIQFPPNPSQPTLTWRQPSQGPQSDTPSPVAPTERHSTKPHNLKAGNCGCNSSFKQSCQSTHRLCTISQAMSPSSPSLVIACLLWLPLMTLALQQFLPSAGPTLLNYGPQQFQASIWACVIPFTVSSNRVSPHSLSAFVSVKQHHHTTKTINNNPWWKTNP